MKKWGHPAMFPEKLVERIFTFLKDERLVDKPIHKYFKPLDPCQVEKVVKTIANELKEFI